MAPEHSNSESTPSASNLHGARSRAEEIAARYADRLIAGETIEAGEILSAHPTIGPEVLDHLEVFVRAGGDADDLPLGALGDYTLYRQIGRGGMGVVYEAWQNSVDRRVALKVLPGAVAADDRAFQRFMNEARAAGKLNHPNVVGVHAMGQEENTPYYVMEYVEGETLAQVLAKVREADGETETPFGKKDSVVYFAKMADIFADVADGLQHAHSKGVVHRDIKPSNLILDGKGRLRILDFGLARLEGQESLTLPGDFVGTPQYMSPEQARRKKVPIDHRTDVYSLGATVYETVAGRPPFCGKDHSDTISQIIDRDPAEPRKVNPRVPRDLETIVLKCLRKEAGDRYGTAEALGQDLRRFVRGDPIEARPEATFEKLARRLWRHRVLTGVTLFIAVLTTMVCGISAFLIRLEQSRAEQAYEAEKEQRRRAEENFQLARDAVDRLLWHLDARIANEPGLQTLRKELLQEALRFYLKFLEKKGKDPQVRLETARAFIRVGEINSLLWDLKNAAIAYEQAIDAITKLAAELPGSPSIQSLLAGTHSRRGALYLLTDHYSAAEQSFQIALSIEKDLAKESLHGLRHRQRGAEYLTTLGRIAVRTGRYEEADRIFAEAARLLDASGGDAITRRSLRSQLSELLRGVGLSLCEHGDLSKAKKSYEQSIRHLEAAIEPDSANPEQRRHLSELYGNLAIVLHRLGELDAELEAREQSLAISALLTREYPDVPAYKCRHADALKDHAALLYRTGRLEECEAFFGDALASAQELMDRFPSVTLARHLLPRCKVQFAQALLALDRNEEAEELLRSAWPQWRSLVERFPADDFYVLNLEQTIGLLFLVLDRDGRSDEIRSVFDAATDFFSQILNDWKVQDADLSQELPICHGLARLLVDAPPPLRDPKRALSMAKRVVEANPANKGLRWLTLGEAYYRNAEWREAIEPLQRAMELGPVWSGRALLFLTMSHWQLGERTKAWELYDEALDWANRNDPKNPETALLRQEAGELLGR